MDGFSPQVIPNTPIPLLGLNVTNSQSIEGSSGQTGDALVPPTIADTPIATPPIAIDTIGTSLDTQQRKILGAFTFGQVGALTIGKYINGVSGELDLSPNGITAKNVNGTTTFSIDGTTGAATFLGTLQAGSLIAGDTNVKIDVGSSGGGRIVLLNSGVPVIVIGDPT